MIDKMFHAPVCMKCACLPIYPHMLMLSLSMKPSIGALLLSKQSELTKPVQQEERTYEVHDCVVHMSLTLSAHEPGLQ